MTVYIGMELSNQMIVDSAEIVSVELQGACVLWNKSDKYKKPNCSFVLLLNSCILTVYSCCQIWSPDVIFSYHNFGVSIVGFLKPCVNYRLSLKKWGKNKKKKKKENNTMWINYKQFYLQWKFVQLPSSLSIPLSQIVKENNAVFHITSFHSHWIMLFTLYRITLLSCLSHFQDKYRKFYVLPGCCLFPLILLMDCLVKCAVQVVFFWWVSGTCIFIAVQHLLEDGIFVKVSYPEIP